MKVIEVVRLLEQDGWTLKRVTGSHRHFAHYCQAWSCDCRRQAERYREAED
ncbi:MAG: type II toxin-antitoxin system HicA family toxin [Pseudonocardiaceae bacterium]